MADHNEFGKIAEDLAVDFLVKAEYKILARNFRYLKAEIDIIAEKQNQIIIIEVKARNTDAFLEPQEAVNKKKIKLLISAANYFVEENNINKEVRFDIISVLPNHQKTLEINHIIDAFQSFEIYSLDRKEYRQIYNRLPIIVCYISVYYHQNQYYFISTHPILPPAFPVG